MNKSAHEDTQARDGGRMVQTPLNYPSKPSRLRKVSFVTRPASVQKRTLNKSDV
jgi:hypothetical protein